MSTDNELSLEEHIPLTQNGYSHDAPDADGDDGGDKEYPRHVDKGKERAMESASREEIFRVDDSDEEDHDGGGSRSPRT